MISNVSVLNKVEDQEILSSEAYKELGSLLTFLEFFFSLLGVVTNVINIRVFVEQGLSNSSTNIGLLCLSVFDLLNCTLMIPTELCIIFDFTRDRFKRFSCGTYTAYPIFISIVFYYCSNWTTVYLSLERSLCVLIPLKIKLILRPGVTKVIIVILFLVFLSSQMTYITSTRIAWYFDTVSNQTMPYIVETAVARKYLYFYNMIANTVMSSVAIIIVAIATGIMINKLNKFKKWRQQNAGNALPASDASLEKKQMSSKDAEMVKSVMIVTSVFLVCLSAGHIPATIIIVIPGATYTGVNRNIFFLAYQLRFLFSLANASINFFFYIRVSSRYKAAFATTFGRFCNASPQKAKSQESGSQ